MSDDRHLDQAIGGFFDIWQLLSAPRADNESAIRARARPVYLGGHSAIARVLGRYRMFVDTRDLSISVHLLTEGYWEMWVTEAMLAVIKPGMTVLDIGANLGYFTLLMADLVGPDGRVLAFEPNPEMAGCLRQSLAVNGFGNARLHELALGEAPGRLMLAFDTGMPGGGHLDGAPPPAAPAPAAPPPPAPQPATMAFATSLPPPLPPEPLPPPAELPLLAPASGWLAGLAARLGFAPRAEIEAARAAAAAAIARSNADAATLAERRIHLAVTEAALAAEAATGARIAAAEAAAAARAAADAAARSYDGLDAAIAARIAAAATPEGALRREVAVRRLDSFADALDADVIKMDVEGFEPAVWRGMDALLARGRALIIFMEFTIVRLADPHGFLDFIAGHGFSLGLVSPQDGVIPVTREALFAAPHDIDHMLVLRREGAPT